MPIRALCVYCGSSSLVPASHLQAARDLGALAAGAGVDIVYGGGRVGMMGAVAEGAQAAGGRVVGILPQHLEALEAGNRTASEYLVVNSMHARQTPMAERSDDFCAPPARLGTRSDTSLILHPGPPPLPTT